MIRLQSLSKISRGLSGQDLETLSVSHAFTFTTESYTIPVHDQAGVVVHVVNDDIFKSVGPGMPISSKVYCPRNVLTCVEVGRWPRAEPANMNVLNVPACHA